MNHTKWINKLLTINAHSYIKNNYIPIIIKLMSLKGSPNFIRIENKKLNLALGNIGGHNKIILSFDIEFQTALFKEAKFSSDKQINNMNVVSFAEEFGMMIFMSDIDKNWYYLGSMFINFQNINKHMIDEDMIKMTLSTYMTVTKNTENKIKQNEKKIFISQHIDNIIDIHNLNNTNLFNKTVDTVKTNILKNELFKKLLSNDDKINCIVLFDQLKNKEDVIKNAGKLKKILEQINYNLFPVLLSDGYKKIIEKQKKLYYDDSLVINRSLSIIQEKEFLNNFKHLLEQSYVVVKGQRDMIAMHNTFKLVFNIKKSNLSFNHFYNIEIFNQLSQNIYGSAQLGKTYEGLSSDPMYVKHIKPFFDSINLIGKSHNPLVDAMYTIIVAIIVNMALNHYFVK